eukprot:24675-Pelagococcus_subviridis.AAC.2
MFDPGRSLAASCDQICPERPPRRPSVILRGAALSDDAATDATAVREVRRSAPRETSRDPLARRAIFGSRARANAVVVVRDPRPLDVRI